MYYGATLMRLPVVFLSCLLCACAGTGGGAPNEPAQQPDPDWPLPVGEVSLAAAQGQPALWLDVGIVVFDPGIPEDPATHSREGIFPEIRKAEARYQSVLLRDVLVASNQWGAVRVLPHDTGSSPLVVTGRIVHSDGQDLVLAVEAHDATGRNWLSRTYRDRAGAADYPVAAEEDPFIDIYRAIANDLVAVRDGWDPLVLAEIPRVTELRYAASLSPEAFADYLEQDERGFYSARRLPAADDPMMARVQRIQNQEYLFIDTVDEQYVELYQAMAPVYNLWRQYGREQAIYKVEYQQRAANRESHGRRGTYAQMEQTYSAFRSLKIQQQDLHELAIGFNTEVAPTVLEVGDTVFRLNGTLDTQYDEWRDILRKIFALETGIPASP
jgi:hypothetical protein